MAMPTPKQRIERVLKEIQGVTSQYGVTSWERDRLDEWQELDALSIKQERILQQVEEKVFGDGDDDGDDEDEGRLGSTDKRWSNS
jgi:hypothetical protein